LATATNILSESSPCLRKINLVFSINENIKNNKIKKTMFQKLQESKLTYLAFGILAGFIVAYAYKNYLKKD